MEKFSRKTSFRSLIQEICKCIIHLGPLENPRILPCQHSFCLSCLEQLHRSECDDESELETHNTITCPVCRCVAQLPKTGLRSLPRDIRANQLSEMARIPEHPPADVTCTYCAESDKQTPALYYCDRCSVRLCAKCKESLHDSVPVFRDHQVISVVKDDRDLHLLCPEHNKLLQYRCRRCDVLVCGQCASIDHREHGENIITIDDDLPRTKYALKTSLDTLKRKINTVKKLSACTHQARDVVSEHYEHTKATIISTFCSMATTLQFLEKEILTKLQVHERAALKQLRQQDDCEQAQLVAAESLVRWVDELLVGGDALELAALSRDCRVRLESTAELLEGARGAAITQLEVVEYKQAAIHDLREYGGELNARIIYFSPHNTVEYRPKGVADAMATPPPSPTPHQQQHPLTSVSHSRPAIMSNSGHSAAPQSPTVKIAKHAAEAVKSPSRSHSGARERIIVLKHADGNRPLSDEVKGKPPTGRDEASHAARVEGRVESLRRKKRQGRDSAGRMGIRELEHAMMNSGISNNPGGEECRTLGRARKNSHEEVSLVRRQIKLSAAPPPPEDDVIRRKSRSMDSLVRTGRDSASDVEKVTVLWRLNEYGNKAGQLCNPWDVCIVERDTVVVCDTQNRRLQIVDNQAQVTSIISAKTPINANNVIKVSEKTVAVTDKTENCIRLFNISDGDEGRPLGRGLWSDPAGIAINQRGEWAVTDTWSHSVGLYDQRCQLVRRFGTYGHTTGQFNYPHYLAFDPVHRGRLFISDRFNHAVKIFDEAGKYLGRVGSGRVGKGDGDLDRPYGVTVTNEGHVLVSDWKNHRLCEFDHDGRFIRHVIGGTDARWPAGLSLSETGNLCALASCESSSRTAQVQMLKLL